MQKGHILKLEERSDKHFASSKVITVKKDGKVKLSLESREKKQTNKKPSISLEPNNHRKKRTESLVYNAWFYVRVRAKSARIENKQTIQHFFSWRKLNQDYSFKNGLYGVTTMPVESQRVMDTFTIEFLQADALTDDI